MKVHPFILIVSLCCVLIIKIHATTRKSVEMLVAGVISMFLEDEFLAMGKAPPSSWDDFLIVKLTNEREFDLGVSQMRIINSFALVPGAPVIQITPEIRVPPMEIPKDLRELNLFMISRGIGVNAISKEKGRYAIMIEEDSPDFPGGKRKVLMRFVPKRCQANCRLTIGAKAAMCVVTR